jgi:hypothetical protein
VSTRRVDKLVEALGIAGISKSQVSRMAKVLDVEVEAFRTRPLDGGPYTYLWMDALTQKVRERGRVVQVAVVIANGVNSDGCREILGLDLVTTEDGAGWLGFLRSLVAAVHIGGVEVVDAHVNRSIHHRETGRLVDREAEGHCPEADPADHRARAAQVSVRHLIARVRSVGTARRAARRATTGVRTLHPRPAAATRLGGSELAQPVGSGRAAQVVRERRSNDMRGRAAAAPAAIAADRPVTLHDLAAHGSRCGRMPPFLT